jgi:UDP-glucose 4-epimerase
MQSRCFCDVRDVVRVLPKLVETPACHGRVFNIGREEPITIRALAELVAKTLGSSSAIRAVPYEKAFSAGFDDLLVRQPDLTRIRAAVGFEPRISLVDTIRDLAVEIGKRPVHDAAAGANR